jgi:hypothetical protein
MLFLSLERKEERERESATPLVFSDELEDAGVVAAGPTGRRRRTRDPKPLLFSF